jgi:hypothetical protein
MLTERVDPMELVSILCRVQEAKLAANAKAEVNN